MVIIVTALLIVIYCLVKCSTAIRHTMRKSKRKGEMCAYCGATVPATVECELCKRQMYTCCDQHVPRWLHG